MSGIFDYLNPTEIDALCAYGIALLWTHMHCLLCIDLVGHLWLLSQSSEMCVIPGDMNWRTMFIPLRRRARKAGLLLTLSSCAFLYWLAYYSWYGVLLSQNRNGMPIFETKKDFLLAICDFVLSVAMWNIIIIIGAFIFTPLFNASMAYVVLVVMIISAFAQFVILQFDYPVLDLKFYGYSRGLGDLMPDFTLRYIYAAPAFLLGGVLYWIAISKMDPRVWGSMDIRWYRTFCRLPLKIADFGG